MRVLEGRRAPAGVSGDAEVTLVTDMAELLHVNVLSPTWLQDLAYESLPEAQRLHRLTRVHRNSALALRFKRAGLLEAMGRKDDAVDAMRKAVDEVRGAGMD